MGRLILIALRNLRQNRRRTVLLGAAIISVTALLVVLTSVSNGIQETMLKAATTLSTGHVNVSGFYKITSGQAAPVVTKFEPIKQLVLENVPEAEVIVDRLRGWGKVVSTKNSIQVGLGGVDIATETGFHNVLKVLKGDLNGLKDPNTIMLFESQAEQLEVGIGDVLTISAPTVRGAYNSVDVTVVCIAQNIGFISGFSVFTPKETIRDIYIMDSSATGAIQIYLKDPDMAEAVAERLRKVLADNGQRLLEPLAQPFWMKFPVVTREDWTGQKLDVTTWKDEMAFLTWTLDAFRALTVVIVTVLLIIIVIGVMNSMWMAIRERTREIGTLRAMGMQKRGVLSMFVIEAGVLSFGSTVIGALIGVGIAQLLNVFEIGLSQGFQLFLMRDTLHLMPDVLSVLLAISVITFIVTLFSLYPASKAARMKPVTAMQHVG